MNPFLNLYFFLVLGHSRDGSGKPFFINRIFSCTKRATGRSSFLCLEKNDLVKSLKRTARLAPRKYNLIRFSF